MKKLLKKYNLIREKEYRISASKDFIFRFFENSIEKAPMDFISELSNSFDKNSASFIGKISDNGFLIKRKMKFGDFDSTKSMVECDITELEENLSELNVKFYGYHPSKLIYDIGPILILTIGLAIGVFWYDLVLITSVVIFLFGFLLFVYMPYKMTIVDLDSMEMTMNKFIEELNKNALQQGL